MVFQVERLLSTIEVALSTIEVAPSTTEVAPSTTEVAPSTTEVVSVRAITSRAPVRLGERDLASRRASLWTRLAHSGPYTAEHRLVQLLFLLVPIAFSVGGTATAMPGASDAMRACAQEQDDGRRLACYDREMARSEKAYGLNDEQGRKKDRPKASSDAKSQTPEMQPPTLSSKVLSAAPRADGRNVIKLENGQTWVQGEAFEDFAIHAGDAVTIKSGMLGSFFMYLPSKLRTRVTRVR